MPSNIVSLTISLDHWKLRIWRKIQVKDTIRLDKLSTVFYRSMGWHGCHLSEIKTKYARYGNNDFERPHDQLEFDKYALKDIIKTGIAYFKYYYDFGDSWDMTIRINKKIQESDFYPICIDGKNAASPEDVGGYAGFDHFVKVMRDPKHPEYIILSE